MADRFVLDAFAVLALFQDEPGAAEVQQLLVRQSRGEVELYFSVINLGEALYNTERRLGPAKAAILLAALQQLPIEVVPVDQTLAVATARIKVRTRMGYADCFAVALAAGLGATIVTGDPGFEAATDIAPILWLTQRATS